MEAQTGVSKAGDWRNYERVLLPPIRDLHRLEVYEQHGGYEMLREVLTSGDWTPTKVTDTVKASGLRGRGGAGFVTGMKWSFMPPVDPNKPRYLCCNGDESEPGTFKDRQLMEYNPHLVFEGILLAAYAMSITTSYLYIRGEYRDWIIHMERELAKLYEKGYVGKNIMGTDFSTEIVSHRGAGAYIGAEWYASIGAVKHPGPVLYGISGHVNKPGVSEYPTGMLITDLIYEVAGGIRNGKKLKAVVPGGSSTPVLRADQIEGVTMDAESLREAGSMMGTAGMLVLDEDTDMVSFLRRITHFYAHESCGQCTPCREGTGWLENIVTRIERGEGRLRDLDLLVDLCTQMEGRTICALADAAAWPVRYTIQRFREEFEARCKPDIFATGEIGRPQAVPAA